MSQHPSTVETQYSNISVVEPFNTQRQKFDLILKKSSARTSTYMIVNKGLLSTTATHPCYQQRFVAVGERRMPAHPRVFIGVTTVMLIGKAANHKMPLLRLRKSYDFWWSGRQVGKNN